jgi:hypothetical protein
MSLATKSLDGRSLAASLERDIASRIAHLKATNGGRTLWGSGA